MRELSSQPQDWILPDPSFEVQAIILESGYIAPEIKIVKR
jgi:hypothetical protein